jgi:phosphoadenosine phosphosulfate reductase
MEQLTMFGRTALEDKIKKAIDRLKTFEPPEGYYLAFSGGKDSQCIYHLAKEAGVKFDAHYNLTTVDPPELVYFIRENYPDVIVEKPEMTMWQLIVKHRMPPTRLARYCCEVLKERGGEGRVCVTGVRWAESSRRKNSRAAIELRKRKTAKPILFNDNEEARRTIETCQLKGKQIVNPIIDWEDDDVWAYIRSRGFKYCKLYDEGFKRLGCIGCPMAGQAGREREFERWPTYKRAYIRAFEKLAKYRNENGMNDNRSSWKTGQKIYDWWMGYTKMPDEGMDGQIEMDEYD